MGELTGTPLFVDDLSPWNDNSNPVWLASTLLLQRNVDKFHFPGKLSPEKKKSMVSFLQKELIGLAGFDSPLFLSSEECTPIDKEFLVEHCLTHEGFTQALQGEGFFFDKKGDCLVTINVEDHLHLHCIDIKGDLEKSWNRIATIESELGKSVAYSYSSKFGFLTANPQACGTGLVVTLYLQLSALIHTGKLEAEISALEEESVEVKGLLEGSKEWVGDLVSLRNRFCLGINEESILSTLRSVSTKLIALEKSERSNLKDGHNSEIKDKVARAYALLTHSYQIETVEALNEIALLKLGLELGWIRGITMNELNRLFFTCRRGHLLRQLKGKVALEEVAHKRAEFVHSALKDVKIGI